MSFYWYNIFNKAAFEATGLVSRTLNVQMEGRGLEKILITHGNTIAVTHEGTLLPISFLGANPYIVSRDGKAIYLDDFGEVWLGFEVTV